MRSATSTMAKVTLLTLVMLVASPAATLDFEHPTLIPFTGQALGAQDRGLVFDVLQPFDITSAGIKIDPLLGGVTTLGVEVWEVTGFNPTPPPNNPGTRQPNLASGSIAIVDVGFAFYDVPVIASFEAGKRYGISFDSIVPAGWGNNLNQMEFFDFAYLDPPYGVPTVGSFVNVVSASFGDDLFHRNLPHIRVDSVQEPIPEPATGLLFGSALLLAGAVRRFWKKRSA